MSFTKTVTITLSDPVVVSKATDEIDVQINFEHRFTVVYNKD